MFDYAVTSLLYVFSSTLYSCQIVLLINIAIIKSPIFYQDLIGISRSKCMEFSYPLSNHTPVFCLLLLHFDIGETLSIFQQTFLQDMKLYYLRVRSCIQTPQECWRPVSVCVFPSISHQQELHLLNELYELLK